MLENFRKLYALLNWREKRSFVILVAAMLVEALLEMAAIGLIPIFITTLAYPDYIAGNPTWARLFGATSIAEPGREALVVWGSAILLVFFVVKTAYSVTAAYWKARFAQNRALKLSLRLFNAYLRAPYTFHLSHNSSELFRNINSECASLAGLVLLPMVELIAQSTILLGIIVVMVVLVPPVAIVWLGIFLALGFFSTTLLQKRSKRLGLEIQQQRGAVVRAINEGLGGVKEINLMQRTRLFSARLAAALGRVLAIQRMHQVLLRAIPAIIESLGIIGLLGVTVMLVVQSTEPRELVATLSVFAVALTRMKGALRSIMVSFSEARHNSAALSVVYDNLCALEDDDKLDADCDSPPLALPFVNEITVSNLTYHYPGAARAALDGLDLSIRRGEAIGFVGATGSGKSTLLDIIMGIIVPTAGEIRVDGVAIQDQVRGWQAHIGYVPQSIFLIDASVRANIALGLEDAEIDDAQVARAADAAALGELLSKLPDGIDTVVGERGVRLSGGERQRIAIARALYNNPDVLMMDEATSALDNTTELAVVSAVEALKGDRTIVMIAHRLSTVRRCDRIVFLKDGRVDAVGSYDELAASHTDFQRMAEA